MVTLIQQDATQAIRTLKGRAMGRAYGGRAYQPGQCSELHPICTSPTQHRYTKSSSSLNHAKLTWNGLTPVEGSSKPTITGPMHLSSVEMETAVRQTRSGWAPTPELVIHVNRSLEDTQVSCSPVKNQEGGERVSLEDESDACLSLCCCGEGEDALERLILSQPLRIIFLHSI